MCNQKRLLCVKPYKLTKKLLTPNKITYMDFLEAPLVLLIIFYFFYKILQLYATRRERILLIEKLSELPPEGLPTLPLNDFSIAPRYNHMQALRWGLLILGCGFGLLVGYFVAIGLNNSLIKNPGALGEYSIILCAPVLLFGGIGLIISYIIESRSAEK